MAFDIETLKKMNTMLINYLESSSDLVLTDYHEAIDSAFGRNDLRGLREALKDNITWVKDFFKDDNPDIEHILKHSELSDTTKVQVILESDLISSDSQYRTILDFVDNHYSSPSYRIQIEKCNQLLKDYEPDSL